MTAKALAVLTLILATIVIVVASLTSASSDMRRAEERPVAGIDPSVIMRHVPHDLPVESYPIN